MTRPETFEVPGDVERRTQTHLRSQGDLREEGVVLWRGTFDPPRINGFIIPRQNTSTGRFRVPLDERQRISRELAGTGEVIVAQVHSHPEAAFHSLIDDKEAIPRRVGAYSLVVPYFGARTHLLEDAALYRLDATGAWQSAPLATFSVSPAAEPPPIRSRKGLRWLIAILKNFGRFGT